MRSQNDGDAQTLSLEGKAVSLGLDPHSLARKVSVGVPEGEKIRDFAMQFDLSR